MAAVPGNLKYTKEHEWIASTADQSIVRIGITDFAQGALGDIVYIQLPKVGSEVSEGSVCGEVESTKSVSEIYSPVTGTVVSINADLDAAPEVINSDPYGAGWIAEIKISQDPTSLMDASEYESITS